MTLHLSIVGLTGALALSLLTSAPASACQASAHHVQRGSGHMLTADVGGCAYLGTYQEGYDHELDADIGGYDTRVASGQFGAATRARIAAKGRDHRIGTMQRSGSSLDVNVRGQGIEVAVDQQRRSRVSIDSQGIGGFIAVTTR